MKKQWFLNDAKSDGFNEILFQKWIQRVEKRRKTLFVCNFAIKNIVQTIDSVSEEFGYGCNGCNGLNDAFFIIV